MASYSTIGRIADLAAEQWGLITRRQAEDAGISTRTIARLAATGGILERVAQGVYRVKAAPVPQNLGLRAAWLQLAPDVPAWKRTAAEGVVSHRSAAALYGVGDLPPDRYDFTLPKRRQTRRDDVRIHTRDLNDSDWLELRGLPVTLPARTVSDLLYDSEDPEAVARIVVDAIRNACDYPGSFTETLAPHSARFGLRRNDGLALLRWFLYLVGDPETPQWMKEAERHVAGIGDETAKGITETPKGKRTLVESRELTVF